MITAHKLTVTSVLKLPIQIGKRKLCVMVAHSDQFEEDQFSVFITGNTPMRGMTHGGTKRFATAELATAFAKEEASHYTARVES